MGKLVQGIVSMDGKAFVEQLKAENEKFLSKLDAVPLMNSLSAAKGGAIGGLAALLKIALKNEIEAAEIARLYRDVINPDEERHHQAGCAVLAQLASTPAAQDSARRAAARLLEIGDQARSAAMEKTGAPVIPGC